MHHNWQSAAAEKHKINPACVIRFNFFIITLQAGPRWLGVEWEVEELRGREPRPEGGRKGERALTCPTPDYPQTSETNFLPLTSHFPLWAVLVDLVYRLTC